MKNIIVDITPLPQMTVKSLKIMAESAKNQSITHDNKKGRVVRSWVDGQRVMAEVEIAEDGLLLG